MKTFRQYFVNVTVVYEDGAIVTDTLTPAQLAGLKRSKQWRKRVSMTKNFTIEVITKFPK